MIDLRPAIFLTVEGRGALLRHLLHPGGQRIAQLAAALHHLLEAERIPDLEGSELPAKAPPDGPVHVGRIVRDLRDATGRVGQQIQRGRAEELAGPPLVGKKRPQPLLQIRNRFDAIQVAQIERPRRLVLAGLRIDRLDDAVLLLVETGPGLLTERALFDKRLQDFRRPEGLAALVVGGLLVQVTGHVEHDVEPHHVGRAEGGRLRPPHERARERVDLLDRVAPLLEQGDHPHHTVDADAVADEVGHVVRHHDPLAQVKAAEPGHAGQHLGSVSAVGISSSSFR